MKPARTNTLQGLFFGILAGLISAAFLAFIYDLTISVIPFIYINIILCLLFGAGIGYLIGFAAKTWGLKSSNLAGLAGLFVGIVAWYLSWVFWISLKTKIGVYDGIGTLTFNPAGVIEGMKAFNEVGFWSVAGDENLTGTSLWVVWIVEGAIIVFAPAFTAGGGVGGERGGERERE